MTDYNIEGDVKQIACSYKSLPQSVNVGNIIYIADGSLTCVVTETHDDYIMVQCNNDCNLGERKNMNLPGVIVDLPTLTDQDENDLLEFGIKYQVDFVAASFVRKASDVEYIRQLLA